MTFPLRLLRFIFMKSPLSRPSSVQSMVFITLHFFSSFRIPLLLHLYKTLWLYFYPPRNANLHWRSWSYGDETQRGVSPLHRKLSRRFVLLQSVPEWSSTRSQDETFNDLELELDGDSGDDMEITDSEILLSFRVLKHFQRRNHS